MTQPVIKPPEFEIKDYRPIDGRGNLRATFSVVIRGMVIRDCRLVQETGKPWFVVGPQRQWQDGDGKTKYQQLVQFTDAQRAYIEQRVKTFYDLQLQGKFQKKGDAA